MSYEKAGEISGFSAARSETAASPVGRLFGRACKAAGPAGFAALRGSGEHACLFPPVQRQVDIVIRSALFRAALCFDRKVVDAGAQEFIDSGEAVGGRCEAIRTGFFSFPFLSVFRR